MITIITHCNNTVGGGHLKRSIVLNSMLKKDELSSKIYCDKSDLSSIISNNEVALIDDFWNEIKNIKFHKVCIFDFPKLLDKEKANVIYSLIRILDESGKFVISLGHFQYNSYNLTAIYDLYPNYYDVTNLANHHYGFDFLALSSEYKINPKYKNKVKYDVLVTFGNSDPENFTEKVINNSFLLDKSVCIVIGSGFNKTAINKIINLCKEKRFDYLENVTTLYDLFLKVDLVICAFGITAFEAILLKKNLICFVHYDWQYPSAKFYSNIIGFTLFKEPPSSLEIKTQSLDYSFNERLKNGSKNLVKRIKNYAETDPHLDVLLILAHVGDELDAVSFILKCIKQGKKVGLVFMSDGLMSRYERENIKERLVKDDIFRILESWILSIGIKIYYMFDLEDNNLQSHDHLKTTKLIEVLIERHTPLEIYTNDENSTNLTHSHLNKIVKIATRNKTYINKIGTIINPKNLLKTNAKYNKVINVSEDLKIQMDNLFKSNTKYFDLLQLNMDLINIQRISMGVLINKGMVELQGIIYESD